MQNKLKEWLLKNKIKQNKFAEIIGISKGMISLIVNNLAKPSLQTSLKIQQATNNEVQPIDFYEEESK